MKKKIIEILPINNGYKWEYCSLGGVTRVKIASGQDIAHLRELDRKLWTVLSCPVSGLEFDSHTLQLMDTNHDGKLRIDEVVDAAEWITTLLRDPDMLLDSSDSLSLDDFADNDLGNTMRQHCQQILSELGSSATTITIADVKAYQKVIDERYAKLPPTEAELDQRPYGDNTDAVRDAVAALRDKMADFFMRCSLIRFDADCKDAVDVSVERIAAIAAGDVAKQADDIASYPLARPNADGTLKLDNINPVWQKHIDVIRQYALPQGLFGSQADSLDAISWDAIKARIDAYDKLLAEQADGKVKEVSKGQADDQSRHDAIDKVLHVYRDFYTLIKNYVFFKDFYRNDPDVKAIFQSGRLFIDQRCCELCMRVDKIDAHAAMAAASGMFLLYCTCTSREKNETINVVAVLTDGDIDDLNVGKNAIYYDRAGHCYDAVVTKIVDNPISIRQAFWSPYRKFWKWCTDKINKSATEKEGKALDEMTSKADIATKEIAAKANDPNAKTEEPKKPAPFDIAKFAGIFAAIGMAIGYIGSALAGITSTIGTNPLNVLIFIAAIILVISGPSMFIAWTKLRKRNLGPMLNGNGWAVNAVVLVNVRFGATLTSIAKYPKLVLDDPFAEKKTPAWKKWLIALAVVVIIAAIIWLVFFLSHYLQSQAA